MLILSGQFIGFLPRHLGDAYAERGMMRALKPHTYQFVSQHFAAYRRNDKDQPLIKIDDDEAQADVRAKEAALENARISLEERRRYLKAIEKLAVAGAATEGSYYAARTSALSAEKAGEADAVSERSQSAARS